MGYLKILTLFDMWVFTKDLIVKVDLMFLG